MLALPINENKTLENKTYQLGRLSQAGLDSHLSPPFAARKPGATLVSSRGNPWGYPWMPPHLCPFSFVLLTARYGLNL